jgi:hypothetical protein
MVAAWTAEASRHSVDVKNPQGQTVRVLRSPYLADPAASHGVNLDAADQLLEEAGYVAGHFRWNGDHYKAVVASEAAYRARAPRPVYSDESMAAWRASPEGLRHAAAMGRRGTR